MAEDQLLDVEDLAPMEEVVEGGAVEELVGGVAMEEQVVDQQVGRR